jgi:hypothetical protein
LTKRSQVNAERLASMGIARFATLSEDSLYASLNSVKGNATAFRQAQQAMSRKTRFSNNWKKAADRIFLCPDWDWSSARSATCRSGASLAGLGRSG